MKNEILKKKNKEALKFFIMSEKEKRNKSNDPHWLNSNMTLDQFMENSGLNSVISEGRDSGRITSVKLEDKSLV